MHVIRGVIETLPKTGYRLMAEVEWFGTAAEGVSSWREEGGQTILPVQSPMDRGCAIPGTVRWSDGLDAATARCNP